CPAMNGGLYRRLLRYVKPYRGIFSLSVLGMAISAATEVALPAAAKPFLDGTFVAQDPQFMRWVPYVIVILFLVRGLGMFMGAYASAYVGQRVVQDLRRQMFARMLTLPQAFYGEVMSGKL